MVYQIVLPKQDEQPAGARISWRNHLAGDLLTVGVFLGQSALDRRGVRCVKLLFSCLAHTTDASVFSA